MDFDNGELKKNTSKRIKELRKNHGYTMEILADKIGISKSTISKWENGNVDNMRQDNIIKLAEVFNVSPAYIMGYDKESVDRVKRFTDLYSQLDEEHQNIIDSILTSYLSKQ